MMNNLRSLIIGLVTPLLTFSVSSLLRRLAASLLLIALLVPLVLFQPGQKVAAASRSILISQPPPVSAAPPEAFIISDTNSVNNSLTSTVSNFWSFSGATILGVFNKPKTAGDVEQTAEPAESSTSATSNSVAPLLPTATGNVRFDFDGDGKADPARWRSSSNQWLIKHSSNGAISSPIVGTSGSVIAPADYDGDGKTDAAMFNASSGTWTIKRSSDNTTQTITGFGQTGDKPLAGDYDGDSLADAAVWRSSDGTWYVRQSSTNTVISSQWGQAGDIPVAGNYDGDARMDYAVYRPSDGVWYVLASSAGYIGAQWGIASDIPVPADYDNDGKTDFAVYRGSTGTWYVIKSSSNGTQVIIQSWGNYGDQPTPADYDNDGKADFCIWRPTTGVWHLIKSNGGSYDYQTLGVAGDIPAESAYLKQIGGQVAGFDLAKARLAPKNATGGSDLYSRNFSWGTGLVTLAGRAGLDVGLGVFYNSLIWTRQGSTMVFDADYSNITPGFRFGFPTIEPAYYDAATGKFAYLMVTPSGRRVEFKQIGASGSYETADSSYRQLTANTPKSPNDPITQTTLTVAGTDGTILSYLWKGGAYRCSQIKEANGNFISLNHDDQGLLRTVTDTLGRIITVNYDPQLYPTSITQDWQTNNGAGAATTHTYATFSYTNITTNTDFGNLAVFGPASGTNLKVLNQITFGDNSSVRFDYNNYGQVWRVRNHAIDGHELNHTAVNLNAVSGTQTDCPRFSETRSYTENFNNGAETAVTNSITENQSYNVGGISGTATLIQVALVGHPNQAVSKTFVGATGWQEGLPLATEDWADNIRQRWTWTNWTQDDTNLTYINNPRIIESKVGDVTNTKKTTVEYYPISQNSPVALYGLVKEVKVYDTNQTTVLKRATTEYNLSSTYTTRRIIGLPQKSELFDENGFLMSKVTYSYDEENFAQEPEQNIAPIQHDNTNFGTGFIIGRGNLTSTTRWDVNFPDNLSQAVTSKVRYDVAGSPVAQIDALNRKVKINYTDSFNDNQNRNSFAYPTKLTDPAGYFSEVKYRYDIGANVWAKSPAPQNQTIGKTTERLFDSIGRLSKETILNSGAYTRYEYPSNQIQSKVYSTIVDTNTNGADTADEVLAESFSDGAGRVRQSRTELPNSTGGFSGQLTEYDLLGRVKKSTVPTEIDANWTPSGDDATRGWLWNEQEYDWKGRVTRTVNTDGTDTIASYDGCGCAGGQITTVKGENITETDWQGNNPNNLGRRTQKIYDDILGRTYKTETLNWDNSVYSTVKTTFNGRDQAVEIKNYQGTETSSIFQTTTATFDGHGRLKTRHRPEQDAGTGTIYNYNADDSISTVTDARGAGVQYSYNNLGLVSMIDYTVPQNSTIPVPTSVSFDYDALGNRTQMTDALGTVSYQYNQLSQITAETRSFTDSLPGAPLPNNGYKLEYTYQLGGQLKSYKDPFGVQINYAHDKIGRLNQVTGSSSSGTTNYASNAGYRAWGALTHLNYGNGTEMNVGGFNNKLQATSFELKRGTTQLMSKQYDFYGDGLVKKENDLMNAKFDRAYKYDHLARMNEARSAAEARGQTDNAVNIPFRNNNQYDVFNNRTQESSRHFTRNTSLNTTYQNNRILTFLGYDFNNGYDAEGNELKAPISPNKRYIYDAGGQLSKTYYENGMLPFVIDQEFFDYSGDGLLIKTKTSHQVDEEPAEIETLYRIRSTVLGGEVVSELNGGGNKSRTFVRANGTVIACENNGVNNWMHKDLNINSLRSTNSNGQIVGNGGDNGDTDIYELDPVGKSIGFYDPYAYGYPDPQPTFFEPAQGFASLINGQVTTFTVDGIQVTREHFSRMFDVAYGGVFGLIEYQARVSARPPRLIGLSVGGENFPATIPGANRAISAAIETGKLIIRTFAVNNSWALNLSLLPNGRQLEPDEVKRLRGLVNTLLDYGDCKDFIKRLLDKAQEIAPKVGPLATGEKLISYDILGIFDKVNQDGGFYTGNVGSSTIDGTILYNVPITTSVDVQKNAEKITITSTTTYNRESDRPKVLLSSQYYFPRAPDGQYDKKLIQSNQNYLFSLSAGAQSTLHELIHFNFHDIYLASAVAALNGDTSASFPKTAYGATEADTSRASGYWARELRKHCDPNYTAPK